MTGEITSTYEGRFKAGTAALLAELDTLNSGAATSGADVKSIVMLPVGLSGESVDIYTLARTA